MAKGMRVALTYRETGERLMWTVWRHTGATFYCGGDNPRVSRSPYWMLRDHDGYERVLESNWVNSAARVRELADFHGCDCAVS